MFINDLFLLVDQMGQTIGAVIIASIVGIGFLFFKYRNGIVFRIGLSIAVIASYAALAVDFFNYSREIIGDLYDIGIVSAIGLGVVLVIIAGIYLNKTVIRPINKLIENSQKLAEGNLTINLDEWEKNDEIGKLYTSFKLMISNLGPSLQNISVSSTSMNHVIHELASDVEEINASSEEISAITQQLSVGAQKQTNMINLSLNQISELNDVFKTNLNDINGSASLIESIASQVNILALNASIEAARAGEYGRGFAVVAENIRQLSTNTKSTVDSVKTTVEKLESSMTMSIDEINKSMEKLSTVAKDTAIGSEEASAATEEQTATTEEINARTQEIANVATQLEEFVSRFTI
ncbi:MAG: methyl-accepting chemotaxis protein [Candidatus Hodarchaeales archaeon]|jgi:methyl-accepting chemotaxis protein